MFSEEIWVEVIIIGPSTFFGETVHVELSNIGMHVFVFEVDGENIGRKLLDVLNNKSIFFFIPANYMTETCILHYLVITSSI